MKTKVLFLFFTLSVVFLSCGKNEPEVESKKGVFKVEVTNSENVKFFNEIIVLQITDDKVDNVVVTNTGGFETVLSTVASKTLQTTRKGSAAFSLQTQQAVSSISLSLGFLFDISSADSETELYPFTCTIKVFKDNKLIETKTHTVNKNTIETFTSFYN
ncbi:MAG: hypothetical protein Q4G63_04305 [Bacteroidia bacterium]|nr:hypothetical protein [Bacteroidia bacterium]